LVPHLLEIFGAAGLPKQLIKCMQAFVFLIGDDANRNHENYCQLLLPLPLLLPIVQT
jgi:hypothetical protein